MPPIEFSMVQSIVLWLILPSIAAAAGLMALFAVVSKAEFLRSLGAPIALLAGLTAGLAAQKYHDGSIPFLAVERIEPQSDPDEPPSAPRGLWGWDLETGWRSLYFATVFAVLSELLVELFFVRRGRWKLAVVAHCAIAALTGFLLTPRDLIVSRPSACALLVLVILLNQTSLRAVTRTRSAPIVPLAAAVIWGGTITLMTLLSHSGLFANLGMLISSALVGVGIGTAMDRLPMKVGFAGPACFYPGLILGAQQNTYSDVPIFGMVLAAIAPVVLLVLWVPRIKALLEPRPTLLAALFSVPCAIAVGLAIHAELF